MSITGPIYQQERPADDLAPDLARIKRKLHQIDRGNYSGSPTNVVIKEVVHADPRWRFYRGRIKILAASTIDSLMKSPFYWSSDQFGYNSDGSNRRYCGSRAWFRLLTKDKAAVLIDILDSNWPPDKIPWKIEIKHVNGMQVLVSGLHAPVSANELIQLPQVSQQCVPISAPAVRTMEVGAPLTDARETRKRKAKEWHDRCMELRKNIVIDQQSGLTLQAAVERGWKKLTDNFKWHAEPRFMAGMNDTGTVSNYWRKSAQVYIWYLCLISGSRHVRRDPMIAFHQLFPDATYRQFGDVVNSRDHRYSDNYFAIIDGRCMAAQSDGMDYGRAAYCTENVVDYICDVLELPRVPVYKFIMHVAPNALRPDIVEYYQRQVQSAVRAAMQPVVVPAVPQLDVREKIGDICTEIEKLLGQSQQDVLQKIADVRAKLDQLSQ